jgi:hypothetical protein
MNKFMMVVALEQGQVRARGVPNLESQIAMQKLNKIHMDD